MYLYRFDTIRTFHKREVCDPFFRGTIACFEGGEVDIHSQAVDAWKRAPCGHAVYSMSFWDTLEIAQKKAQAKDSEWPNRVVLQRVRRDHPVLQKYQCGDDEHLQGEALFFWKTTVESNVSGGQKTDDGIPHSDIEILTKYDGWVNSERVGIWRPRDSDSCLIDGLSLDNKRIESVCLKTGTAFVDDRKTALIRVRTADDEPYLSTRDRNCIFIKALRYLRERGESLQDWFVVVSVEACYDFSLTYIPVVRDKSIRLGDVIKAPVSFLKNINKPNYLVLFEHCAPLSDDFCRRVYSDLDVPHCSVMDEVLYRF